MLSTKLEFAGNIKNTRAGQTAINAVNKAVLGQCVQHAYERISQTCIERGHRCNTLLHSP